MFTFTKNLVLLIENNQLISPSHIIILTYEITMNKRFNIIGLIFASLIKVLVKKYYNTIE